MFTSADVGGPYRIGPLRIGSPICEDAWFDDVTETLAETGAEILLVPNGSPYYRNKYDRRVGLMVARVIETKLPLVYLNMIGGQDDQVFDGGSFVLNPGIELAAQLPVFEEAIRHVDFERTDKGWRAVRAELEPLPDEWEQDYHAMVLSLRDYLGKSGFKKVLLGLSGGIDSALVATVAADALGPANVRCVMLPSEFTSKNSLDDAKAVAQALGCRLDTVSIEGARDAVEGALSGLFEGTKPGVAEENIQSRLRGLMLMGLSNKFGEMLLTTGNKSEMAVGYATIYGDMAGGYNPLKDMYKTRVFRTCRWRNENHRDWMLGPEGTCHPGTGHRQAAKRGAAGEPEGRGFAAALSGAGRDPGTAGRRRHVGGRNRRGRLRQGDGEKGRRAAVWCGMEADPIRAGHTPDAQGVLAGPPLSDGEPLARQRLTAACHLPDDADYARLVPTVMAAEVGYASGGHNAVAAAGDRRRRRQVPRRRCG